MCVSGNRAEATSKNGWRGTPTTSTVERRTAVTSNPPIHMMTISPSLIVRSFIMVVEESNTEANQRKEARRPTGGLEMAP